MNEEAVTPTPGNRTLNQSKESGREDNHGLKRVRTQNFHLKS